jgi:hypothetical protein
MHFIKKKIFFMRIVTATLPLLSTKIKNKILILFITNAIKKTLRE